MTRDANAIFRAENGALERLSALETLKGLKNREAVTLGDLVRYLESRGLWAQFGKITLADLRDGFGAPPEPSANDEAAAAAKPAKKKKQRILEDELADIEVSPTAKEAPPEDGGMSTDEVARQVLPFVEGNGDVTVEDIAEYTRIDRKVLRHHLAALVKQGRLERIGVGRHAVYSTL
ncbi:MAG TPA: winged helix-turn-helix domain-containing protein [Nannocystis sp.]|jgi:DNA-binding transcriptional ArsR family regulator